MGRKFSWDKFWGRVDKNGECWVWRGAKKSFGYGYARPVKGSRRKITVHRMVWEYFNDAIPEGVCVLHSCDNPPCVNPKHLFLGTQSENGKDRHGKGRDAMGERSGQAKITDAIVLDIRKLLKAGVWVADVARHVGMSYPAVDRIAKGLQWKHLGPMNLSKRKSGSGMHCTNVEGKPPNTCRYKAATLVRYSWGEAILCSEHAIPVVLSKDPSILGIEPIF